jgi:hypothetical protein
MMFVTVAIAYLAAAAAPPATAAPAIPMPPATQPVAPPKEKKVCTSETVSGSIMPKRVCRSQSEAEAEARDMSRRSIELPSRQGGRN